MVCRHSKRVWVQACGVGLAAALLVSGCATTNDEEILARLMRETQVPAAAPPVVAGDVPDEPALDLPPDLGGGEGGFGGMALTIQPDCLLQIKVREDPGLDGSYPVNEIGAVALGYVGPVILYNRTERDAAVKIRDILKTRGAFKNSTVSVKIIRASYDKIQVAG